MKSYDISPYSNMEEVPIMLTVEEMGKLLRVSRNTAYEFVSEGHIPYTRVGHQIRIYRGDVFDMITRISSKEPVVSELL